MVLFPTLIICIVVCEALRKPEVLQKWTFLSRDLMCVKAWLKHGERVFNDDLDDGDPCDLRDRGYMASVSRPLEYSQILVTL